MKLGFQGVGQKGDEIVVLDIDRDNKKLKIASSMTGYSFKEMEWKQLFDPGKEKQQEKATDKLNDKKFRLAITLNMMKYGYKPKK